MATAKQELDIYVWEGKEQTRAKSSKGEKSGRNETLIKAELRQQGILPSRVRRKPKTTIW